MAEEQALPSLYPPAKKVKSEVWKYFGYRKNAQGSIVEDGFPICKECGKEVAAKRGNTSNMFTHLRHNHSLQFSEVLKPLSNRDKAARHRARINANPISRARYLARRRESYEQRKREGKITHSPIAKLSMTRQQELRQNWRRYKKIQREKIRTITPQSCGHIEVNSQCQQESVINSASSETDCSSATHESPVSSWMKQEPKNEIIEWENMNFEVHTDAEQDSTLSNAISTATTPVESLLTSEMLTITKQHCLLECNKVKIEALEKQVQDLQEDRMFLRTQIENLTSVLSAYVRDGVNKNQET
ncbi:uncharacterized protein [Misgurnus anguillicaudatus]|uniref:uncharacterized protein isoform X1 n=1 Tax=Misgurnus anguillicaudatus TaxID=75329 RepID=UPI003CCF4CD6